MKRYGNPGPMRRGSSLWPGRFAWARPGTRCGALAGLPLCRRGGLAGLRGIGEACAADVKTEGRSRFQEDFEHIRNISLITVKSIFLGIIQ